MIEPSPREKTWRNADPAMLIITLILIGFGLVTIYSADGQTFSFSSATFRQGLFAVVGCGVMLVMAAIDYRFLRVLSIPMYLGGVLLLVLVLRIGAIYGGAQRWFDLGFTTFQPSEPAKLGMIVALAAFIAMRGLHMRGPISFAATGLIAVIPAALVFVEPDLGTSLVYAAIWLGMITVARIRWIYLILCLAAIVPIVWFAWNGGFGRDPLFHDYQKDRVTCFLHPQADEYDFCANVIQARITIGQAGLTGHRFADIAQVNEHQRLAVSTTDFAFAHATGNFGFIGAMALFVLYLLLIWRYLRVVHLARDPFGQLLAMGASAMLFFHAFVNIGMNVNLLPVVGIPLPFISAGGTPLVTILATQGIMQSILMHRNSLAYGAG